MRNKLRTVLLFLLCLLASGSFVYADAAVGEAFLILGLGAILVIILIVVLAIVLISKAVKRKKRAAKEETMFEEEKK